MAHDLLTKEQLKREIRRFFADKDRGISIALFAELCGVERIHLLDVFVYEKHPLTEYVQTRVNKAYKHWKEGRVKVMKRNDNTRYVDYRRDAKPPLMPQMGVKMTSEGLKLRVGVVNRHDYSQPDLKEQLGG